VDERGFVGSLRKPRFVSGHRSTDVAQYPERTLASQFAEKLIYAAESEPQALKRDWY
jgi:hypothetical protein